MLHVGGRLATKQTSKSPLLKSIHHTQSTMAKVSLDVCRAQYLCYAPSTEGLVYPYFSRSVHMLTPAQMAKKITGEDYHESFTKIDLIQLMLSLGAQFFAGLDWGFTHKFAVVTAALIGHILYIIDVISVSNLEPVECVDLCKGRLNIFNPLKIFPDNAMPANVKLFRKNGFRMIDFKKDILDGIEATRARIMPGSGKNPAEGWKEPFSKVNFTPKISQLWFVK